MVIVMAIYIELLLTWTDIKDLPLWYQLGRYLKLDFLPDNVPRDQSEVESS